MPTELKVVMFTDQVKSTPNTALRTPAEIKQVNDAQKELTTGAVSQSRGTILKDTGDGHFVEFRSCSDAVRCGFILQQRVKERNEAQTNELLRFELHIGIDFGELVVLENADLRGDEANIAARFCSKCPAGEVYFTEKVKNELYPREARVRKVKAFELRGVRGKVNVYRLVEWLGEVEPSPNPFIWRDGITKAEDFFNRENEQRTIRNYLRGHQNCQIVGSLGVGKTSLLLQLQHVASEWEEATVVAYLDLQDPRCFTLSGWLGRVGRQFGWSTSPTSLVEFADCVEDILSEEHNPVLCLDEFEELTLRREEFTHDFFLTLRSCGQQGMSIITASQHPLNELIEPSNPTSPFYNTFPLLRLYPFADEDAEDFVTLHRPSVPPFMSEEKEAILAFAKGHPLTLQVACFHVLQAKENDENLINAMQRAEDSVRAHLPSWRR